VIEYLVMAFFAGQPVKPAAVGAPNAGARPSTKSQAPQLSAPVEISSKLVSGSRNQASFKGDVVVKHRTMDLRCDEMIAHYNGPREVTRVECVGNVRAVDGERTAQGERADFDVPTGVLVVTGNPEARDAKTHLRGSQVRMTLGTRNYEVENAVVTVDAAPLAQQRRKGGGKESPAQATPAEISSKRVTGTPAQAVFTGDVVVKHRTMDLRCDKMTAYYNGAGEVTRADCVGNVRAVDGVRTAKGERAEFNVPTGVLVLTGNPEARDPTTHLRGTKVRMTLGNENFEVENAVVTVETAPLREQQQQRKGGGKGNPGNAPGNTNPGGTKQP
jgi:lipopolysaccharide transport protein LptA